MGGALADLVLVGLGIHCHLSLHIDSAPFPSHRFLVLATLHNAPKHPRDQYLRDPPRSQLREAEERGGRGREREREREREGGRERERREREKRERGGGKERGEREGEGKTGALEKETNIQVNR